MIRKSESHKKCANVPDSTECMCGTVLKVVKGTVIQLVGVNHDNDNKQETWKFNENQVFQQQHKTGKI